MSKRFYVMLDPDGDGKFKRVYPTALGSRRPYLWKRRRFGRTTFSDKGAKKAIKAAIKRFGTKKVMRRSIDIDPFKKIEKKFGLRRSSGDNDPPGSHTVGSYHFRPARWGGVRAYDYGDARNSRKSLIAAGEHCRRNPSRYKEVFGPFNFYIKNGVVKAGAYPAHNDHLHIAIG